MTEDEKTIKAWAYEKLMNIIYKSAHYSEGIDFNFDLDAIVNFIRIMAPDCYTAIQEKIKKEMEEQDEV